MLLSLFIIANDKYSNHSMINIKLGIPHYSYILLNIPLISSLEPEKGSKAQAILSPDLNQNIILNDNKVSSQEWDEGHPKNTISTLTLLSAMPVNPFVLSLKHQTS